MIFKVFEEVVIGAEVFSVEERADLCRWRGTWSRRAT